MKTRKYINGSAFIPGAAEAAHIQRHREAYLVKVAKEEARRRRAQAETRADEVLAGKIEYKARRPDMRNTIFSQLDNAKVQGFVNNFRNMVSTLNSVKCLPAPAAQPIVVVLQLEEQIA